MESRIPKPNCRWKDKGPSDLNAEVWPETPEYRILQWLRNEVKD